MINSFVNNQKFDIFIGKVNYIDYKKTIIPSRSVFDPLLYKRHNFKHEREFKYLTKGTSLMGHRVETNLEELIEDVRIAPESPDWFKNIVQTLMKKFDLNKIVSNSELDERPPVI